MFIFQTLCLSNPLNAFQHPHETVHILRKSPDLSHWTSYLIIPSYSATPSLFLNPFWLCRPMPTFSVAPWMLCPRLGLFIQAQMVAASVAVHISFMSILVFDEGLQNTLRHYLAGALVDHPMYQRKGWDCTIAMYLKFSSEDNNLRKS